MKNLDTFQTHFGKLLESNWKVEQNIWKVILFSI